MSAASRLHRALVRFALSAAHIYAWLAAFQYFYVRTGTLEDALASTALAYALTQTVVVLLTPYAARTLRRGVRRKMVFAVLSAAAAFVMLGAAFSNFFGSIGWGIGLFALLMGVYRAFYRIPYELASRASRTRLSVEFAVALAPALAGFFLTLGPGAPAQLFFLAGALLTAALLPLTGVPEYAEGFAWNYRQTFHELFDRRNSSLLALSVLDGIEGAVLLLIWPVTAFVLLNGSYPLLGLVLAATFFVTMFVRALLRRIRIMNESIAILSLLAFSAWIMRLAAATPLAIVLVDTYHHGGAPSARGRDIYSYEHASDNGTYVDEYTALKEMGMALGRIAVLLIAALWAPVAGFGIAAGASFVIAAFAAAGAAALANRMARTVS